MINISNFPLLRKQYDEKDQIPFNKKTRRIHYLDNAATTQKPIQVINSITNYYSNINANVHRGRHYLSEKATYEYEESRKEIAKFINAENNEIIFTSGTTDGINLIVNGLSPLITNNTLIVLSQLEHHSNMVPWQMMATAKNCKLAFLPIDGRGDLILEGIEDLFSKNPKGILSITHISNLLGTINPIKEIISIAKKYDYIVVIDGAQGIAHKKIDVKDLNCDFYCFSGHKIYGPMGIGIVYGKSSILEKLIPFKYGGEMISNVSWTSISWNSIPHKFEAGTPNVCGSIGLAMAIKWFKQFDLTKYTEHEQKLNFLFYNLIQDNKKVRILGNIKNKIGINSFIVKDHHPHDVAEILDLNGVAVRSGFHCCQPILDDWGLPGTIRASFALYTDENDVKILAEELNKITRE